jgi:hypothetical protein
MNARPRPPQPPRRRVGRAVVLAVAVPFATGCSEPPSNALTGTDWCWLHYNSAPPGALTVDDGPDGAITGALWREWLRTTSDTPHARHDAHRIQRDLVERFVETESWTDDERNRYRAAASEDPTPDTVCETFGARVIARLDGTLPPGWDDRFLDPANPAFSELASANRSDR